MATGRSVSLLLPAHLCCDSPFTFLALLARPVSLLPVFRIACLPCFSSHHFHLAFSLLSLLACFHHHDTEFFPEPERHLYCFHPVTAVDSAKKAMEFLGLKDGKVKKT
jgi:hypothetical protein